MGKTKLKKLMWFSVYFVFIKLKTEHILHFVRDLMFTICIFNNLIFINSFWFILLPRLNLVNHR